MTEGEKLLWSELKEFRRTYGVSVRRQVPVGPYIADFAIHSHKTIIEVDGEHNFTPEGLNRDAKRDAWFAQAGYPIIHITTADVFDNLEDTITTILARLGLMK